MSRAGKLSGSKEVKIKYLPDGTVYSAWWSPEIAVIVCKLCGKGGGYEEFGPSSPRDLVRKNELGSCYMCQTRNPYCG